MGQKMMIFVLPSQFSAFVLVAILLITPQGSLSLIRESVNSASYEINDEVIASFLDRQQQQQQKGEGKTNGLGRSLETFKNSQRFGQRCGNNNLCGEGLECTEVNLIMGNRCLPNACFQEQTMAFQDVFDVEQYKANLYNSAGVTEDQVLAALSVAKNQREFLESPEFQSLTQALHENLQPLETLQQISRNCIQSENATVNGTVTYTGLHIEVSRYNRIWRESAHTIFCSLCWMTLCMHLGYFAVGGSVHWRVHGLSSDKKWSKFLLSGY